MAAAFLITLREGLEAALIIAILMGVLRKMGLMERGRAVWGGVSLAIAVSVVAGLGLHWLGIAFEGRGEEIFEGLAMLAAAAILTWMILWMRRQGRHLQASIERDAQQAVTTGQSGMLFGLAFVAVVREGIETALFLTVAAFSSSPFQTVLGGLLGLGVAILVGRLIYLGGSGLDLRRFFRWTGFLLLLFAAGLLAHGVHELQEAALLPTAVEHLYDLNPVLDENGVLGSLLKALFGYNGNPSLIETLGYAGYLLGLGWAALRSSGSGSVSETPRAGMAVQAG